MDTLTLTIKLAQAMWDEDHDAINRILAALERRLSPEDVAVILEGLCGEGMRDAEPEAASFPLVACA